MDDVEVDQDAVEQSVVWGEDALPQHTADHGGKRPRQDQNREDDPATAKGAVQDDRDDQPAGDLQGERDHDVEQRVDERRPRRRVIEQVRVVAESDELARGAQRRRLSVQAGLEADHQRVDHERGGDRDRRRHQPAAEPRILSRESGPGSQLAPASGPDSFGLARLLQGRSGHRLRSEGAARDAVGVGSELL